MKKGPRVILIAPDIPDVVGEQNVSVLCQMPLNLAYLKAVTPPQYEVDIIDEAEEPVLDEQGRLLLPDVDVVGISAVTYQINRAYQIAQACREAGIPVVIGGVHASLYPDEVAQYADAVATGNGLTQWPLILQDLARGRLAPRYDGGPQDLKLLRQVYPDREFLKQKYHYRYSGITTTAGCPFRCDFCVVPLFQARRYIERPVEDVLDEFEKIQGQYRGLVLTDENLYAYRQSSVQRARRLYTGMVERGIYQNFFGFTSLNIHEDDVTLAAMSKAGCVGVLIGIESLDPNALKQMRKGLNLKITIAKYRQALNNIRRHGIAVWGAFIFGSDDESPDVFKQTVDFVLDAGVDIMTMGILSAVGETPLRKRLQAENRIFRDHLPADWFYFSAHHLTYLLRGMSLEQFIEGIEYLYTHLFNRDVLRQRYLRSREVLQNENAAMFALRVNMDWRHVMKFMLDNLKQLRDSGTYERALQERHVLKETTA